DVVDVKGVLLVDVHQAAVTAVNPRPALAAAEHFSAVVLAAAEGARRVGRIDGDAVERGDRQVPVNVIPNGAVVGGGVIDPDAAIVTVYQLALGVQGHAVVIDVRAVAVAVGRNIGPGAAAVCGLQNLILAANINSVGVCHHDGGVVPALVAHVVWRGGGGCSPGDPAVGALLDLQERTVEVGNRRIDGGGVQR